MYTSMNGTHREDRATVILAVEVIVVTAFVLFGILFMAGCASESTKHKDAYALDVWTAPEPVCHSFDVHTARDDIQVAGLSHVRERHTSTATPPPTAAQRAGLIVGTGLGIGTLAIVILAVLCPSLVVGLALRTAAKWRAAFHETIDGIEAAKVAGVAGDVQRHLVQSQTLKTQALAAKAANL